MRTRGVGGLEESFDGALLMGRNFIALDNMRGRIDSPAIESFLTEDRYLARAPYSRTVMIDPRRIVVMFTSNKAELTTDLASRSSCVRIVKQRDGYRYRHYPEGDVLAHVAANQPLYLGAVFTIVREWHALGKPRIAETRHDFRVWAQILDQIVQGLLDAAPLLDDHRDVQRRMANPALNWARDLALAVVRAGWVGKSLLTSDLVELLEEDGTIEIPGLQDHQGLADDNTRTTVLQSVGRRLKRAFGDEESISADHLRMRRQAFRDEYRRSRYCYVVTLAGDGAA
jgi:hypothetical protein